MTPTIFNKIKAMTYKNYGDGEYHPKEKLEADITQETPQVQTKMNELIKANIIVFDNRDKCGYFRVLESDQRTLEV